MSEGRLVMVQRRCVVAPCRVEERSERQAVREGGATGLMTSAKSRWLRDGRVQKQKRVAAV
jgi:hypothetical protein